MGQFLFKNQIQKTYGNLPQLNDKITAKIVDISFQETNLSEIKKPLILGIFPSILTGVCEEQVAQLEKLASKYSKLNFSCISMDLPTALSYYSNFHGINHINFYSDFKFLDFGKKYGFLMENLHLLGRGILILDSENHLKYLDVCDEVTNQVNFAKLETFLSENY